MIKNKTLIGLILICLLIVGLLTITYFLNLYNSQQLNLVITKNNDTSYNNVLIKNKEDYQNLLTAYSIKDIQRKDFQKYDYIVSFIPYTKTLKINNIDIVLDKEIIITFDINPKVEESSDKLLIYFIPIAKDAIKTLENVKQIYK